MPGDTITLTDPRSNEQLALRRAQRGDVDRQANANINAPPGTTPSSVFLAIQGTTEERTFTGLVTGPKLADDPDYSDDWRTALAEYVQRLEAFAYSRQYTGYTLDDGNRDDTGVNVVLSNLEWEYEAGSVYQVSYDITLVTGAGVLPDDDLSIGTATPGGGWAIDGTDLGRFDYVSVTRDTALDVAPRAYASGPEQNDIKANSSAPRQVTFRGVKTGTKTQRNDFDDTMEALVKNRTVTLSTDFPGYDLEGMVLEYAPERDASTGTNMHRYELVFHEGVRA